ncbi:MAG TPA: hypothetical protein VFN30_02770 [Chitinophagaceae bacterium]|nr:hypothetical protein [Chitinophagaceae bacterium]
MKKSTDGADKTKPDIRADKTGTNSDADKTQKEASMRTKGEGKLEKPKRRNRSR